MSDTTSTKPHLSALALIGALAACSNDVVDLGGETLEQGIEAGATCTGSGIVEGDVYIENQAQLDALLGCQEIRGNLTIEVFEDTDLTPLSAVRSIEGQLTIGAYANLEVLTEEALEAYWEKAEELDAIVAAGWLPSLAGVESLEFVGGLGLSHISAPSLEAFANLRRMTGSYDADGGGLSIVRAPNLVDLAGLENARGARFVELQDNPALVSLDGLVLGRSLNLLHLINNPALSDIDALAPLESVPEVFLQALAIRNVDALANLRTVFFGNVALSGNPELTQADALKDLQAVGTLVFENCPKLDHLPTLANISGLERLKVVGNDTLTSVSLDLTQVALYQGHFGATAYGNSGIIEIGGNPQLLSLSIVAGIRAAGVLSIHHNAGLASIDLGTLESAGQLQITGNDALTEVDLGALATVDSLSVIGNPLLSTAELRNVRTFESEFSFNADDPAP